ncbi:DNA primase [Pleurocapsales cyanobacterium LEGE 06147]|nr:DNA primase [Pleurocapsales cyanobacterium LEGE 06147]
MEIPPLHPDTVEEVKQRVDIVDVISEYVVLRKRGKDYVGLCPFHQEKTPSFSVSPTKQMYYCFGCSAGGNTFKFLMEIGKQSFAEVVLDLARRYQVPVKTLEPQQRQEIQRQLSLREQLYEIVAVAGSFYEHALRQSQGEVALSYLQSERQLSESTIKQFQLGYAPAGWETLYRYLVEQKRYPVHIVEEAGLIKKRNSGNGYYDVFRDRLIIPIFDPQGRTIAFGSRTLTDEQPKYLNSPETPLFDKSKTLFALDKARSSIPQQDRAIVVEGYFDAIALHEAGITNVVASLGTALTSFQIKQLLRYTPSKQVILNFDADSAGTQATQRAIGEIEDLIYGGVVQLRILNLPDGKDADEFIKTKKNGVENYRQALGNAPLWLDWQIEQLIGSGELKTADRIQQVARGMVQLLNHLQDANLRNYYLGYCAELLSQGDARLVAQNVATLKAQLRSRSQRGAKRSPKVRPQRSRVAGAAAPQGNKKESIKAQNNFQRQFLPKTEDRDKQPKNSTSIEKSQPLVNIATNPETELLEQAEALLLRIYLHCPQYRQAITEALEERDLLFSLPHHRFVWQQIIEIETNMLPKEISAEGVRGATLSQGDTKDLLSELQNYSFNFPEAMTRVSQLFYLNEKTQEDIFRAKVRIQEAIASLEQVACTKYQLYCTEQLHNLDPTKDLERIQYYYQEIQHTAERIKELEQIRLSATQETFAGEGFAPFARDR